MENPIKEDQNESINKIFEEINIFRKNPKSFLDKKEILKKKKLIEEYENHINTLQTMEELKIDKELCEIANLEIQNFSNDYSNYLRYQIGEEFKSESNLSENFSKEDIALIAIDDIEDVENLIPNLIVNKMDKEKKGRNILTNQIYTHIGISKLDNDEGNFIILIFAKIKNKEDPQLEKTISEEKIFLLPEEENKIMIQIKEFRENPKSFLDKKEILKKKKLIEEYENYINNLDKMEALKPDKDLCEIANLEIQKFSNDYSNYLRYQIGEEFKSESNLSENFSKEDIALIAIDDIEDVENLIPNLIVNKMDKEKKGRNILTNQIYTHIGISKLDNEEGNFIILIFARIKSKEDPQSEKTISEEKIFLLPEEENKIMIQIKEFRENPKSFLDKKEILKKKKLIEEYENYINMLKMMGELKPDKELCEIANLEIQNFSNDYSNYLRYQIGEEFKSESNLSENFSKEDIALIAIDDIEDVENLIPNLIVNKMDKEKKGRNILTNQIYTHIGISKLDNDDGNFIILILATKSNAISSKENNLEKKKEIIESQKETDIIANSAYNEEKIINNIDNNESLMPPNEKFGNIGNETDNKDNNESSMLSNDEKSHNVEIETDNKDNNESSMLSSDQKAHNVENETDNKELEPKDSINQGTFKKDKEENVIEESELTSPKEIKKEKDLQNINLEKDNTKEENLEKEINSEKKNEFLQKKENDKISNNIKDEKSKKKKKILISENPLSNNSGSSNTSEPKQSIRKKEAFFFTSINIYYYNISNLQMCRVEKKNKLASIKFEFKEEQISFGYNKNYKIFYIKFEPEEYTNFYFYVYYSSNKYYYNSDKIQISKNNNVLGHIKLYNGNYQVSQINFTNENILFKNKYLLTLFNSDKIYLKPLLEKYKLEHNINIDELLNILELFSNYESFPYFLKDLKFINYSKNINYDLSNNSIFNKMFKIISKINIKDDNNNEIKKKCYYILLDIYGNSYYKYNIKKFVELINSGDLLFKASISRLISCKSISIKDLNDKKLIEKDKIVPIIIENSCSSDELKNIFLNYNNIIEALNSINIYYDIILSKLSQKNDSGFGLWPWNWFSSGKIEIKLPSPTEKDDVELIYDAQRQILEKEKNNKNEIEIIDFNSLLKEINNINEKSMNLNNLIILKKMIILQKEKGKKFDIKLISLNNESIHDTGVQLSMKNNRFTNKQIMDFIKLDDFYMCEKYNDHSKRDPYVFNCFDIKDNNETGFEDFINLKMYQKFPKKKKIFYQIFINKMNYLDDLNVLFKLFPKEELDYEFVDLLLDRIQKINDITYLDSNKDSIQLYENIYIIFDNIVKNKIKVNRFTNIIENYKFEQNRVKEIYIYVLSKNNDQITEKVNEEFSKYFIKNLKDLNAQGIYLLIKSCSNNKHFLQKIFNNIENYTINENDFYAPYKSSNFELYELFVKNNYINDPFYLDTNYFESIGVLISKIYLEIKELRIPFLKISDLIENNNNEFLAKLRLVFINESTNPDDLNNNVINNLNLCKSKISQLDKINNYLIVFEHKTSENIIKNIQDIINRLRQMQIVEILQEKETANINNFGNLVEKSNNLRFKDSFIFMKLYEELNKEKGFQLTEIQLFNDTLNLYQTIMKKIINYKNVNFMSIEKIEYILDLTKNKKEEINSEMEFISNEFKDYINANKVTINSIKTNLINFANLKEIKDYLNGYLFILSVFQELSKNPNFQKTDFTTRLSKINDELGDDNIQSENVEKGALILREYGINIYKKNEDNYNDFVLKIYGKKNEIKFCVGKTDVEIKNLNEFLQDRQSESGNLQPEDFDDFIGCKKYVNEVLQSQFSNDKELDHNLKENFKKEENKYLIIKFNNYLEKYGEIKELYEDSIANKSEITKSLIQKVLENSKIIIKKVGNNFEFIGEYGEKKEKFDLNLLLQLKNKALFAQNMIKEDEIYKEQITKFNEIVLNINSLSKTVNNLILSGYPPDISINLKIENNKLINSDNKAKDAKEIIRKYVDLLKQYDEEITKSYKNKPYIRFFYGPLFLSVIETIKKDKEITFLLKAISNGKINKVPKFGQFQISDDASFSEIFSVINNYLEECFTLNSLNLQRIFEENKLLIKKEGLYRVAVFNDIEKNLLLLYNQLTGKFPLSNTVLICSEHTSNEEIKAFLFLSFRCDYPILFCLLGIEKLDSEKRVRTIKLINKFDKKYGKEMRACLVIIYLKNSEMKGPLCKIIPDSKMILLDEIDEKQFKYNSDNIEIFTSERSGFGKTEEIKTKINKEFKNYKYFPLGGEFTRKEIIKRLINFKLPQNKIEDYVIHFDLSETNLNELLQEILFKILILKKLDINEEIFYFGKELKLKIELPNGFYNYMDKFPILKLFKITHLKQLLPLKVPTNVATINDSSIQIVANTLKSYKENKIGESNVDFDSTNLLPNDACQNLIDEFLKNKENEYNYYQKMNFIKLLSVEFRIFKECFILDPTSFNDRNSRNSISKSRNQIIKSILESSVFFTKGPYDKLIRSQSESQQNYSTFDEEKLNEQALKSLEDTKDNVTFDSITASTLFLFNGDKTTFTAITKQKKGSEEYNRYYELINTQSIYGGQKFDLPDYSNKDHYFYLEELKKILGLPEMLFDENEINELNNKIKEETKEELDSKIYNPNNIKEDRKLYMAKLAKKNGNYVYTRDNFIKSVIILLKIQASIPVILMGETGCGKTSLLKMLSIFMNKGSEKMKTLNVHAGTNEEDIINFMNNTVLGSLEKDFNDELNYIMNRFDNETEEYKQKYNREKYLNSQKEKLKEKKIWVFFDELNTCNSMGLITEIMCKRTMHGEPLPDNLVFLGAVNPYRTMTTQMKQSGLTYHTDTNEKSSLLVYTVNPLPHTLMNYIFNFSSLSEIEEREYIKSMIQQNITKYYPDKENNECQKLIIKTLDSICQCHNFIRRNYDASSVSLREIRRFNIFFKFFLDYLKNKSKYKDYYSKTYDLLLGALNITIYLCYYLRISDKNIRNELADLLFQYFDKKLFLEMPKREVVYIAEQFIIDVDKGIALNRSLMENLFTSFICIVNRIPLIIVGKPGEGKSLTIQTINQTMKGIYSKSPLFQEYPQLFMYNYQGSETSTSQGIIETFDKARAYAKNQLKRVIAEGGNEKKEKFIAMIFFDEMGLAERSPNNPLKAIHSQLEYDDNEFKIAFVGISNWKIDASKMNRCLTLSKPDPDKEDLTLTADIIAKALDNTLATNYKTLIEALAISYYEYKKYVNNDKLIENFHGNRDFYHLIKCAMRELIKVKKDIDEINKDKILTKIGLMALTRNFGGLSNSLDIIKAKFKEIYTNYNEDELYSYNILECIKDNLNDYHSRFLMLVANSTIIKYLENVLESQRKDYIFLTGSQFQDDKKAAEKGGGYSEDLLNKIQYQMSKDCVLILKNLEVIYPSLYELFNQNYIKIGNKYFSKIAFASSKSSSEVHRNFRVILLITQEQLNKMKVDPPLLNRFEKQIVSFRDSLTENQIQIAEEISNCLQKIKTFNNNSKLVYNLPELMINCNNDEIEGLIYKICNNEKNKEHKEDNEFIENEIFKIIVPTFCQDIIASVKYSGFANAGKNSKRAKKIFDIYKKREINNFEQFLKKMKKDKNVIYTFSSKFEISEENNLNFNEIHVDAILSENQVQEKMSQFYEEKSDYLIFKFVEKDLNKMNHLAYLVNNFQTKYRQENENDNNNLENNEDENLNIINTNAVQKSQKKIIFLVHLNRKIIQTNKKGAGKNKNILLMEELISNLDDSYDKYFIDNLRSERNDFTNILDIKSPTELVSSIINFDKFLDKNLNIIISYFDYNFLNKFHDINLKDYTDSILRKLIFNKKDSNVEFLRKQLIQTTLKNMNQPNMIPKVYTSKFFQNTDIDFFQVLATYMLSELSNKLLSVVNYIEKQGFFSCLLIKENNDEIIKNDIIINQVKNVFNTMDILAVTMPQPQLRANKINLITNLSIPSIHVWLNDIKVNFLIKEKIAEKYMKNENFLRPRQQIKEDQKAIEKYSANYKKLIDSMKEQFYKNENINEIFASNFQNIKKSLFYDSLMIYSIEISDKFSNKNNSFENPIKFVELLLQLKFNIMNVDNYQENEIEFKETYFEAKEDFNIENYSEAILYLESYKNEIIFISEVFCLLSSYLPSTFEQVKEIIKSKIIKTEVSNRNPSYKKKVNEVFYIIIESLLKSIYKNKEKVCELEIYTFYPFFDSLKYIEATLNKINQKFVLFSNELYSLRNLLAVYNIFKDDENIKNVIKEVLGIIGKDNEDLQNNNFENLKDNILNIKKIISEKYGENSDKLADYMSNLLRQQYRKIDNQDYKFELLNLAFENDKLIQRSLFFIEQTIKIPFPILIKKNSDKDKLPNKFTFFNKEACEKYFLDFINQRKNDRILSFYEKINNETFTQVLLYYFEMLSYNYFNDIIIKYKNDRPDPQNPNIKSDKECNELILNQNLLYLNKALKHLDNIFIKENLNDEALNNLGEIYSIAYIKLYIKYLAEIYRFNRNKVSFEPIINVISNTEFNTRKIVKIFFFKNFLQYFENFSLFNDYILKDKEFPFRKEYIDIIEKQNSKVNYILNYHFIVMKNFEENYFKSIIPFINLKNNNFKNLSSLLNTDLINNNGLDLFFCLSINHLFSYYYSNEKEETNRKITALRNEFNNIENNLNLSPITLNLLKKLFNFSEFINIVISKQDNNNNYTQQQFEILMNSLRIVLKSAQNNNNNFYYNLLTPQCKEYIKNNYIIGTLPYNNVFLKSYYSLNVLLNSPTPIPTGYYVCTCGQYYTLGNCTCPSVTFDCYNKNCKLKISGTGHKLLGPEAGQTDHWRVILKEEDKNVTSYSKNEIARGKIPCIFLDEFKRRYVDRFINEQPKGIKKEEVEDFIERRDNIRTLDEISFRLLNYILYSHLFFSNILGNISDEEMNNYTHGPLTCIRMLEKNWEIMEGILNEKGINNIKSFMNIIFDKINELINSIEDMSTIEKRQEFETSIKNYIGNIINNKNEYESEEAKYNNYNEKIKGGEPHNIIEILLENYAPSDDLYMKNEYPHLEKFLLSKYPDINELERCLGMQPDYTINYCLLNQVLICNEEYGLIKNVVNINKLVDLLYKRYNNKIERDTAKVKKILECFENENIEEIKENILEPYINSWNKIKSKCTKYLCRPDMPELNITMNHSLIYFLPDDGELYGGMYLASAYRNLIDWQNNFIKIIIDSIGPNSLLRSYLSQLNQEIPIQEANEEDVVNINEDITKKLKNMIIQYSMRDIFKNGKIDYKEFKKAIKFDFDSIETELGRLILPGIKQFISQEANEPIKFVTYLYETFRSTRSSIITNYNTKYPARDLTIIEEELLYSFIDDKKKTKQNFSKDILSSCQILIDYIQKENFNKNEAIYSVISKMPEYIEIDELLKSFFIEHTDDNSINTNNYENNRMFSINTLINIYNLIEFICWDQFKNNLNEQYKMHLSEDSKNKIKTFLDTNLGENNLIKKQDIANAVRRLISRYLSGKRGDTDISELKILFDYIQRADLWRTELQDNEDFQTEIYTIFQGIKREIKLVIKCDQEYNKCLLCQEQILLGEQNPCESCEKCNSGLRIGHALEFYELINEEIFDPNKFKKKETLEIEDLSDDEKQNENKSKTAKTDGNQNKIIEKENLNEITTSDNENKRDEGEDKNNNDENEENGEIEENEEAQDNEYDLGDLDEEI